MSVQSRWYSVREFLRIAYHGFAVRISSVFFVPFTILTWILPATYQKVICGIGAIIAFGAMAYFVWEKERKEVLSLKERIRPKLKCSFNVGDGGCVRPGAVLRKVGQQSTTTSSSSVTLVSVTNEPGKMPEVRVIEDKPPPESLRATYYRIKVEADGVQSVTGCKGRLNRITRGGLTLFDGEPETLPFAPAWIDAESTSKTIHAGAPEYLDFLAIAASNQAIVTVKNLGGASSVPWLSLIDIPGDYHFHISILSATPTVSIDVVLHWTGAQGTSSVEWAGVGA